MVDGLSPAAAMSQTASAGRALSAAHLDDLGRAVLLLARELWVVIDRQRVTEAVLQERGIDVTDAIATYQPVGKVSDEIAAERTRFAEALMAALHPSTTS